MSVQAESHVLDNGRCVTCLPVRAKFNPEQLRDPGGEDGGQWVKSPAGAAEAAAKDLLELAGRIDLDPREKLISSDRLNGDNGGDVDLNWAVVHSPAGNEVRLGVIPHFDSDKWRAGDKGGTAVLDAEQVAALREDLRGAVAEAKKALKEADDRFGDDGGLPANPTDRDKALFGMEAVARGVIPNDWADLHWNVYLTDDEDEPWLLTLEAGDPETNQADGVQFAPKKVGKLLTALGRIDSELADTAVKAAAGAHEHHLDNGICVTCDNDEDGEWEEAIEALMTAIAELLDDEQVRAAWDPAKHPRGPGGRFRSTVDRLKDAIQDHLDGKGGGHPFDGFEREQLRRVAKARGIELKRGESRDSIAEKLLDHLKGGRSDSEAPTTTRKARTKTTTGAPKSILKSGSDRLAQVAAHYRDNPVEYEGRRRKSYDLPYDAQLKEIVELQGFDAKPQVGTREQVDAAVAAGWVETWRGVGTLDKTPAEINHDLRFGDFEPGRGIYGNGVYASTRRGTAETFRNRDPKGNYPIGPGPDYGPEDYEGEEKPDSLLRIAVDPAARVGDYDELDAEMKRYFHSLPSDAPEKAALADVGRYAAARGYDIMIVRNHGDGAFYPGWETDELNDEEVGSFPQADQYVILNRSAVMIQRAEDAP